MKIFRRVTSRGHLPCHEVAEVLQAYLDDELNHTAARRVRHHLADCLRCGLEVEAYQDLKQALRRLPTDLGREQVDRLRDFAFRLSRDQL